MQKAAGIAEKALLASAGLAFVLGVTIWIGGAYGLIGVHEMLGYVLVASLWTLAAIAARSGVDIGIAAAAAAWGALVLALGWTQGYLIAGSWHWVVQLLHAVISMASVPWGKRLASMIRRSERAGVFVGPMPAGSRDPAHHEG
jgi:hypothetical protein